MTSSFSFDEVEHFTCGSVGPKGQRVFYLQFGNSGDIVTLKAEKGQVHALADFLESLLDDAEPVDPNDVPLALDLIEPINAAWAVASIGVALDSDNNQYILVAEELQLEDDTDDESGNTAVARITVAPGQVAAFIERAREAFAGGRPPCPYCGAPLNHADGWCACHN